MERSEAGRPSRWRRSVLALDRLRVGAQHPSLASPSYCFAAQSDTRGPAGAVDMSEVTGIRGGSSMPGVTREVTDVPSDASSASAAADGKRSKRADWEQRAQGGKG